MICKVTAATNNDAPNEEIKTNYRLDYTKGHRMTKTGVTIKGKDLNSTHQKSLWKVIPVYSIKQA